ncbi:MAG: hypothetical protein DME07_05390 [Candidatus Rokuibacteriota bacterium]|nr:MAG: hypothetical protein DME07_05390 [Candidatus Rokubacteria bacterium]PYN56309.1 MAG: hypothetical protein DMD94_08290 [Candidatus Rokubacteria bacterium]
MSADRTRPFTGKEFLESLRDGREIWIYGERVEDVTTHPAVSGWKHWPDTGPSTSEPSRRPPGSDGEPTVPGRVPSLSLAVR